MSNKNQDDKKCREPDYADKEKDQLEGKQENKELQTRFFDSRLNLYDSSILDIYLISMIWTF